MATATRINGRESKLPAPVGVLDPFGITGLTSWGFPGLSNLRRAMNAMLDTAMTGDPSSVTFSPETDVYEKDGKYVVEIALPGFKKDDINLEVGDDSLTISARTSEEKKRDDGNRYHYREVRRGSFWRTITFPHDVDSSHVDASYQDGILKIIVPPIKPVEAKKVAIKG